MTALDSGLGRSTARTLFDGLHMAATLVARAHRESVVFEKCQVEADETVVRKEKVYEEKPGQPKRRIGTIHHSVSGLTQRGSTKQVLYLCEPKIVPVDAKGKSPLPCCLL
jgi:hypothetical protein